MLEIVYYIVMTVSAVLFVGCVYKIGYYSGKCDAIQEEIDWQKRHGWGRHG